MINTDYMRVMRRRDRRKRMFSVGLGFGVALCLFVIVVDLVTK